MNPKSFVKTPLKSVRSLWPRFQSGLRATSFRRGGHIAKAAPSQHWKNSRVVLGGNHADPSILRDGHDYYMTHSDNLYAPALLIWHSRDLLNWEQIGHALKDPKGLVWAPDIIKHDELFYIYYPSNGGAHVVTARHPAGPWSKPVDLNVSRQLIDPGHVVGEDGKRYLGFSGGNLIQLSQDGLSTVGEPKKIYGGWPEPWDPNRFVGEGQCLEGLKFFKRGGYIYLVSAENGTAGPPTSHMIVVARSKTMKGPWKNSPYNPVMHTESRNEPWWSCGHGTIFNTPEGRWYVLYHAYKNGFHTLGRYTLIEPIIWTKDGWPVVSKSLISGDPVLDSATRPSAPFVDHFKGPSLNFAWQYFEAAPSHFQFNKGLAISASGETVADGMFLTYIPRDVSYSIEAKIHIAGDKPSGGLVLFYSRKYFAGLELKPDGLHYIRDNVCHILVPGTKTSSIELRLINAHNTIIMYYRLKSPGNWIKVDFSFDLSGYNHNTFNGFDSLRPALTASGQGEVTFSRFEYQPMTP